MQDTACCGWRN